MSMSNFVKCFSQATIPNDSSGPFPSNFDKESCLLCNVDIGGSVSNSNLEDKRLFCKIFKVLPPSLSLENDLFNDKKFGAFCQFCSSNVAELCNLERQMCSLRAIIDEMQVKIANCVVNSFATTSCNQNGYFVKRQIYERWFERCLQVPANIWESTPMPLSNQCTIVVEESQDSGTGISRENQPTEFDIRLTPVEKIVENPDIENDDNSSQAGNFAPSPMQDENSNDSVEVVFEPNKPVLPLPCIIKKVKKIRSSHKSKKKHSKKKKKRQKTKSPKKVLNSNKDDNVSEETDSPDSPCPPQLSPMCDFDDCVEETISSKVENSVSTDKNPSNALELCNAQDVVDIHDIIDKLSQKPVNKVRNGSRPPKLYPNRFKCNFCPKKFTQKCNFDAHVRLHTGEKPYKCSICGKAFANQGNMMTHEKIHDQRRYEGEPKFQCEFCDKKYYNTNALATHKFRRHNENPKVPEIKPSVQARCEFCGIMVIDMKNHVKHLHTISEKKAFQCPTCRCTFSDDFYLQMHQSVHSPLALAYQCKFCRRGYKLRFKLNEHLKVVHKITDIALYASHSSVAPAADCVIGVCDRSKKEKGIKPKRRRGRPKLEKNENRISKKYSKVPKTYMCEICGKISSQSSTHLVHIRTHTGEKPYKCKYCDRGFNDPANRLKHQETHDKGRLEGEPRYECKLCGKKFHFRGIMYEHSRRHHGKALTKNPRIKCDVCSAILSSAKSLWVHKRRMHLKNKKPGRAHQCVTCLKVFTSEYRLKIHNYEHMKEIECEDFKCVHCPPLSNLLFSKEELPKHYKEYHPDIKQEDIIMRKTYKCSECPLTYILLKSVLEHIGSVHENIKAPKRIRNRKNKQKVNSMKSDPESETDGDEVMDEDIKDEGDTPSTLKVKSKQEPVRKSTRFSIPQQSNTSKKTFIETDTVVKSDLLSQCKDLRIVLYRVDEVWDDEIEIKEEVGYF